MTTRPEHLPVPLLDLKAQYATIRDEIRVAMDRVVESQNFILGSEVEGLEKEIAAYSGCRFGVGVSSGTDALLAALMAAGIARDDEVVTTPYSFFATAGAIARLGARPVFVDIDSRTFNIDPEQIEAVLTPKSKAVMPVHLYGQMAEMKPIIEIASKHNLVVIEDAAQAIGAERDGRRAGSIGHMGCFSFFPSKNLGGFGDGGMITTNDANLADRLRLLRNHGFQPKYYNRVLGANLRLDALQAAVLRVKLRYLDRWTGQRQENAARYRALFATVPEVGLPYEAPRSRHIYNQFILRCPGRDGLMEHLKTSRIGCEVYYPVPLHLQECFGSLGYSPGDFPISEKAAAETLAVPIYPELTGEMQRAVVDRVAGFYR